MASTRKRSGRITPYSQKARGRRPAVSTEAARLATSGERKGELESAVLEAVPTTQRPEPPAGLLRYAFSFRRMFQSRAEDGSQIIRASGFVPEAAEGAFRPAFLYVERGPGAGQLIPVEQGTVIVGRASVSDLRLAHVSVSRRHAQLVRKGERFYVKDLASQNGTYVNRMRIGIEVELHLGDELGIGQAVLRLRGAPEKGNPLSASMALPETEPECASEIEERKEQPPETSTPQRRKSTSSTRAAREASSGSKPASVSGKRRSGVPTVLMGLLGGFLVAAGVGLLLLRAGVLSPRTDGWVQRLGIDALVSKTAPRTVVLTSSTPEKLAQAASTSEAKAPDVAHRASAADKTESADRPPQTVSSGELPVDDSAAAPAAAPSDALEQDGMQGTAPPRETVARGDRETAEENAGGAPESAKAKRKKGRFSAEVLETYEAGDVARAIKLAQEEGDRRATLRLRRFQRAYNQARAAYEANDGAGAIRGFTRALKADRRITRGWSEYGNIVKKQLSHLYTLLGQQHLKSKNAKAAKKAYAVALKYDPRNTTARAGASKSENLLGRRSSAPGRARVDAAVSPSAPKKLRRAAAIDAAWND